MHLTINHQSCPRDGAKGTRYQTRCDHRPHCGWQPNSQRSLGMRRREFLMAGCLIGLGAPSCRRAGAGGSGRVVELNLVPALAGSDRHGRRLLAYNRSIPGPVIRATVGDIIRVHVHNRLRTGTSVHWHGLPVPNPMDGVPGVTQPAILPDAQFTYQFTARAPGSYLYRAFDADQFACGLFGALIIDDGSASSADQEHVVVVRDPDQDVANRSRAIPVSFGSDSSPDPMSFLEVREGERIRLRLLNASLSNPCTFRVAGHNLIVTHADGRPVQPVLVGGVRMGVGERYDVMVEATHPGHWAMLVWADNPAVPWTVGALSYHGARRGLLQRDAFLNGKTLLYEELRAMGEPAGPRAIDRRIRLVASKKKGTGGWSVNGQRYPHSTNPTVRAGERVRIEYVNEAGEPLSLHVHGHWFELAQRGRPVKDTVIIEPHGQRAVELVADNPGDWMVCCQGPDRDTTGLANVLAVR